MTETTRMRAVTAAVALATFLAVLAYQRMAPGLLGVDAYFHLRLSALIGSQGLIRDLAWLPYTIYSPVFVDDHLLFHLILAPFASGDPVAGGQLYAAIVAACVFACFTHLLLKREVPLPLLWTGLLLAGSTVFLFRLFLVRASGLSLLFLLAGCGLILARRDRWLGPVGFLYAWTYGGFPLLVVMAGAAWAAGLVSGENRWRAVAWAAAGCAAGLVANPYFPDNLGFLWRSYAEIEFGRFVVTGAVGNEDLPYAASTAVRKAPIAFLITFAAVLAFAIRPVQMSSETLFLFLFSTALLCLYFVSRRFVEYWPLFATLFGALAAREWWQAAPARWRSVVRIPLIAIAAFALLIGGYRTTLELGDIRTAGRGLDTYAGAADYLRRTAAGDAVIFHASWGDFPFLFYLNPGHRYIAGLGIQYLYLADRDRCLAYLDICNGDRDDPARAIADLFDAPYAFARRSQGGFIASMDDDPGASRVYEDDHAIVYRIAAHRTPPR